MKPQFKEWATQFLASPTAPMTEEISKLFIICMLDEEDESLAREAESSFPYKVLAKRAAFVGLKLTPGAAVFLACLACLATNPGVVVMFVYALYYVQQTRGVEKITIGNIAEMFPVGFPTEKALSDAWDRQKDDGNMLDRSIE